MCQRVEGNTIKSTDKANYSQGWRITVARNFEEIESMRPIWEEMQWKEPYPIIDADIDQYLSVLQANEDECSPLILLLLKEISQPCAMVIGRLERHTVALRVGYKTIMKPKLRCMTVVNGGILGEPDESVSTLLLRELMKLLRQREADVIFFHRIRADSTFYRQVCKTRQLLLRNYFPVIQSHWETRIPKSVEAFRRAMSSKHVREWRRNERKLAETLRGSIEVVCYKDEKDVDHILKTAVEIAKLTYKKTMGVGISERTRLHRALLLHTAKRGMLRAYFLKGNGVPCAFEFGCRYGSTFFVEYMGYDPKWRKFGPGELLWAKVIEDLCGDVMINTLDYGFGDAEYKRKFGTNSWPEAAETYLFAPRFYPLLINLLNSLNSCFALTLTWILQKLKLFAWLKRFWRKRLQKQVQSRNEDS